MPLAGTATCSAMKLMRLALLQIGFLIPPPASAGWPPALEPLRSLCRCRYKTMLGALPGLGATSGACLVPQWRQPVSRWLKRPSRSWCQANPVNGGSNCLFGSIDATAHALQAGSSAMHPASLSSNPRVCGLCSCSSAANCCYSGTPRPKTTTTGHRRPPPCSSAEAGWPPPRARGTRVASGPRLAVPLSAAWVACVVRWLFCPALTHLSPTDA